MRSNGRWIIVFAAMSAPQPWPCHFCQTDVEFGWEAPGRGGNSQSPTLHHKDGDHENNVFENWAWSHTGCHTRFHKEGKPGTMVGEAHHQSKLTEDQVRSIRRRHSGGENMKSLGREFGVADRTIADVVHRETWK